MMVAVLILLLGSAAAFCHASGMARHQRDLFGRALSARTSVCAKFAGWVLLVAAGTLGIATMGWAVGLAVSLAFLQLGALASVLVINLVLAPRRVR